MCIRDRDDDERVDLPVQERPDAPEFLADVTVGAQDVEIGPGGCERAADRLGQRGEERIVQVGDDETNRGRPPLAEAAAEQVDAVVELLSDRNDPCLLYTSRCV